MFLLLPVALCSLVGLFAPFHWFCDLFNHFRSQAVLAALILLIPMIAYKSKPGIALALAVIALNAGLMGWRSYTFDRNASPDIPGKTVSIISANVNTANTRYDDVIRLVTGKNPDIFIVLEVNRRWVKALEEIEAEWPYHFKLPFDDNFGIAVYAKQPFTDRTLVIGNDSKLPLFIGQFDGFTLMALHPIPPINKIDAPDTYNYLSHAAKMAAHINQPLIVAGDLNTTLWSDNIRPFLEAGLAPANASGIAWTWPAGFFPLALQIDHIFVKRAAVRAFSVLPDIGSDHYPVAARIELSLTKAAKIVVYKAERKMALLDEAGKEIRHYRIALGARPEGHKTEEGDERTPEGAYRITAHNPRSSFHRSLRISYPNEKDIAQAKKRGVSPGGDIMIHGLRNGLGWLGTLHLRHDTWTDGCIAVTNDEIEEIAALVPDGTPIEIRP